MSEEADSKGETIYTLTAQELAAIVEEAITIATARSMRMMALENEAIYAHLIGLRDAVVATIDALIDFELKGGVGTSEEVGKKWKQARADYRACEIAIYE